MNILLVEADDVLVGAVGAALHGPETSLERISAPAALSRPACAEVVVLGARPCCDPEDFCSTWRARYGPDGPLLIATATTPARAAALLRAGADHALILPPGEIFTAQLVAAVNVARRLARPSLRTDAFFDVSPAASAVVSRTLLLKRVNHAFAALLRRDEADLRFAPVCELVREEERAEFAAALARAFAGEPVTHETRAGDADAATRVLRWWLAADPSGQTLAAVATEVTAERSLRDEVQVLRGAEDVHRVVVEATSEALWAVDRWPDGTFHASLLNPAFTRLTGLRLDDVVGKEPREFMPPETAANSIARYEQAIAARGPIEYEDRFRALDGALHECITQVVPLFDAAGECYRIIGATRDDTSRLRTERDLEQSNERFAIISQASSDVVWDWDLATGDIWWNEGMARLLGYRDGEVECRIEFWDERLHPDDRARVNAGLEALFAGHESTWEDEYRLQRADGTWAIVHDRGRVIRDAEGAAVRMVGALNDLTEKREAEDALRRSEERFARAFFSSPVAVSLTSVADGRFVDVNDAFLDMYGFLREEVIGKTSVELNLWADPERRKVMLSALRAGRGSLRDFEDQYRTHSGEVREGLTSWELIELDDTPHLLCIATDITGRRRAENALRQAEQYLRSVVSAAPVMLFALDVEGVFTLVEGAGLAALDCDCAAALGQSAWEHFAAVPELVAALRRSLAGEQVALEVMLGTVVAEMRLSPLRGEGGAVSGVICVGTDVTARRQAERARQLAEDRFKAIAAHVPVIMWKIDTDGICTFSDGGALAARGAHPGEWDGVNFLEVFAENEALVANLRRGLAGEAFSSTVKSMGRWYETAYQPLRGEDGSVSGLIGVSLDITDRREAELGRRLVEERLRSVASNAPVILFALDPAGHFLLAEGAGLAHFGASSDGIVGQDAFEVFGQLPQQVGDLNRALAGEEFSVVIELDGRTWDAHFSSVRGDAGEIAYVIGVATDITERRRAEQALLQAQKLESLGVLAGGVAHDFNNLLVGIMGNAGLALLELPETSPAREAIHAIETAGQRAADLARQMLAYSGKGHFVVELVDLNGLVEEMGQLLRVSMAGQTVLHYRLGRGLPHVQADATQLRQVVMNLVVNAADAIGEREGIITITTELLHADAATLANRFLAPDLPPGPYIALEIRDTGEGMDDATLARIFDPFFTTKFTGRGLGLAAVHGIVRGHRGAIHVSSEQGRGAVFTLLLPAAAAAPAPSSRPGAPAIEQWRAEGTLLVVDDERTVRAVTARALQGLGFEVLEAEDGAHGVEVFEANMERVSCVLLDMTMPRMNGEQAFAAIQELRPGTSVILMSGYNEQDALSHFPERGLAAFVQKPFEIATLRDTVRRVLQLGRAS